MKTSYVYILTNDRKTVLYIGVTNDLRRRLIEHKSGNSDSFTKKYNVYNLVYYEEFTSVDEAISREKQLKNWNRAKKNKLIEMENPNWDFLDITF